MPDMPDASETSVVKAPAKLNLALSVGAPGVDGMHAICSWMLSVDLHDELSVTRLPDDRLSRYAILWHPDARRPSEINWPITRDLAVRAHLAVERHVGRSLPIQMKLDKRIPVGGGLGGGSSDAAAMLRALDRVYGLGLERDGAIMEIAAEIGSDVPFFLRGGSAIVSGLGERIDMHEGLPTVHAVIVMPEQPCATVEVYRAFDALERDPTLDAQRVRSMASDGGGGGRARQPVAEQMFNDLTDAALSIAPALEQVLQGVAAVAAQPVHISGSGSSVFTLCDDDMHAAALAEAIEDRLGLPAVAVRSCVCG